MQVYLSKYYYFHNITTTVITVILVVVCGITKCYGTVFLEPNIEIAGKYNSNFWRTQSNEREVVTYSLRPGLDVIKQTEGLKLALGGYIDFTWYDEQSSSSENLIDPSDLNYTGISVQGEISYDPSDRSTLSLLDTFYITRDSLVADETSNSTSREKYSINTFHPAIKYRIGKRVDLSVAYKNTSTDYDERNEDSSENLFNLRATYSLNSRAALFANYKAWNRDYDGETTDYTSNRFSLNYRHQLNFFRIVGGAGYHRRDFDNDVLEEMDLFSWNVGLLGMDRNTSRKRTKKFLDLKLGQDMNTVGTNGYYTATYGRLSGTYKLIENLKFSAKARYQNSDYDTVNRDDDLYTGSLGVTYIISDYLSVGVEAGLNQRDSNINGFDYEDEFMMLTLTGQYEMSNRQ